MENGSALSRSPFVGGVIWWEYKRRSERTTEGSRHCSSLSQQSLLGKKNKASLGRQYTGETGSYWTVIDCTLGKSGSLAPCQCKHPQISARQNSISPPLLRNVFRTPEDETIEKARRADRWNHANVAIRPERDSIRPKPATDSAVKEIKKQKRGGGKKKRMPPIVRLYFATPRIPSSRAFQTVNCRTTA